MKLSKKSYNLKTTWQDRTWRACDQKFTEEKAYHLTNGMTTITLLGITTFAVKQYVSDA